MLTAGELVDRRYRLLKRLGSGALGEVWAARNETVEREVAIKFLVPAWAIAPRSLEAFFREAKSSGKIRHPSVVQFLDIGETEPGADGRKIPYVVMELLECEKLESLLSRERTLPVGTALRLCSELSWALVAAHDRSLIHERIEPANVLLHRDLKGEIVPKLVDFGISRLVDDLGPLSVTGAAHEALSPLSYLSPEQIHGDVELDGRADVYAIGVLLHRLLVGRVPFEATDTELLLEQIEQQSPHLEVFEPPLDAKVVHLVNDCLQRNRRLRPTMRVLAERCDGLLERIDAHWKALGALVSIPEERTARKLEAMRPSSRPPRSAEIAGLEALPKVDVLRVPNIAVPVVAAPSAAAAPGAPRAAAKPAAAKATLIGVAVPPRARPDAAAAPVAPRVATVPMPVFVPDASPPDAAAPQKPARPTIKITPKQPSSGAVDPPTLKIENNPFAVAKAAGAVPRAATTPIVAPSPRGAPKAVAQSVPPPVIHGLASASLGDDDDAPISSGSLEEIPASRPPESIIPISDLEADDMVATQERKAPLPKAAPPPSMEQTGDELHTINHLIAERLSGTGVETSTNDGLQLDVLKDLESELLKRVATSRASLPDLMDPAEVEPAPASDDVRAPPMEGLFGGPSIVPDAPLLGVSSEVAPQKAKRAPPPRHKAPPPLPPHEKHTIGAVATTPLTEATRRNNGPAVAIAMVVAAIAIVLFVRMRAPNPTGTPAASASASGGPSVPAAASTSKVEELPTVVASGSATPEASAAPSASLSSSPEASASVPAAATTVVAVAPTVTAPPPPVPTITAPPPATTVAPPATTVAVKPPPPPPTPTASATPPPKPKPKGSGDPYFGVESAGF